MDVSMLKKQKKKVMYRFFWIFKEDIVDTLLRETVFSYLLILFAPIIVVIHIFH